MPTTKKKLSRRNLSVDKSKTRIKFTELVTPGEDPKGLFELKDRLGTGSYGEVFQALHTKSGETFAIKIITMDDDKVLEETVRREIEVLAETSHRNIVSYFGSYLVDESLWIVMEFCNGGSVARLCQILETNLQEDEIAIICKEALKGLRYLHSLKKIHRDLKGGNILLTEQGEVKLADFGVSANLFSTFSKRNTFVGTPYWMSPEEMAEMVPPHASVHPMRVLFIIPREPPPQLQNKKAWTVHFHDFLSKCVVKDPQKRGDVKELLKHKFVQNTKSRDLLVQLVEKLKAIVTKRGYLYKEDEDSTGTFIKKSSSYSSESYQDETGTDSDSDVTSESGELEKTQVESGTVVQHEPSGTFVQHGSNEKPKKKAQRMAVNAVELQEELRSIYRKDCTIRIPFLHLNYINPMSLFYEEGTKEDFSDTLSELCSGEASITMESISSKTTLGNLLLTLDYHTKRQTTVPMTAQDIERNARIVRELNSTIKTILRL